MPKFFVNMMMALLAIFATGCYTASYTPYGVHRGGHDTASMVNDAPCAPGNEECLYWYRVSLYEQCQRAAAQRETLETGASVALPVIAGIIESATRPSSGFGGGVRINQYVQRSYTYCQTPPMPPVRY